MHLRLAIIVLVAAASSLTAQDRPPVEPCSLPAPDQPVAPVKPSVEKIDATHYRIGKVTFDQKTREIRFPAKINMDDGLLEYLVVHEDGKVHESLIVTDISATQSALINYPGDDNRDDTIWHVFPKRVPPLGTNVTVIITPYSKTPLPKKP